VFLNKAAKYGFFIGRIIKTLIAALCVVIDQYIHISTPVPTIHLMFLLKVMLNRYTQVKNIFISLNEAPMGLY
jgi:hypothetical protein